MDYTERREDAYNHEQMDKQREAKQKKDEDKEPPTSPEPGENAVY
jgi:hypothetical protein